MSIGVECGVDREEVLAMTVSDYDSLDLDAGYLKGRKINDHPKPMFITAWTHGARRVSGQEGWETVCAELQHEVGISEDKDLCSAGLYFLIKDAFRFSFKPRQ